MRLLRLPGRTPAVIASGLKSVLFFFLFLQKAACAGAISLTFEVRTGRKVQHGCLDAKLLSMNDPYI